MKLRNQVLTLSLATVLVPWFGWKLVQELERFLRAGQETTLLATARTVAQALPPEFRGELVFGRERVLPLREFDRPPIIDGYLDDWLEPGSTTNFTSADGNLRLRVLGGRYAGQLFLFCRVEDSTPVRAAPPSRQGGAGPHHSDAVELALRSARGLNTWSLRTAAPGPLLVTSQDPGGGQIEAWWTERPGGYDLEIALPPGGRAVDLAVGAIDAHTGRGGRLETREAGTMAGGRPTAWLSPAPQLGPLQDWLDAVRTEDTRAFVIDQSGWVVADTGPLPTGRPGELSWAGRALYRSIAGDRTELRDERPDAVMRLADETAVAALDGEASHHWGQDPETAVVRHTVAMPVETNGRVIGAVVMDSRSDGLLLVTNRALGRLLLVTVAVTVLLATGLWFFATRLSRRVRRLSTAVSEAMDDAANPAELPLTRDRDELGDLARNNARLLRSVADYTRYLRDLAGRLSHELKTPLAITRSSLDNLATGGLDDEARRYLARAREGLDRQGAIVRAMSEANRLESTVAAADWERVDLVAWLRGCAEAYRSAHPGRDIRLQLPAEPALTRCAPDLLTQALDKLVDNALGLTDADQHITLELAPKGNWRHLRVRNSGTRLPEQFQDQLFDSLVSVREPGAQGTHLGLGLFIVRLVAEAHDGRVSAHNLPGDEGVEFTMSLPAG
ncbi:HAMP domain-containing protein [Marinihelvus fidelis]|uniref:histidine kinase n=1 Tax=Marinihelvus fidelis TaxID=2613842 RepID=A0A5N0T700_9GAMM|nr:ATP-binding protein [Marinihelvus fidelis]KAA9130825.1 HAMP domain-containing protein [Marinihelvus fidelis]